METRKLQRAILAVAISAITILGGCSPKPRGIPEATATVGQALADTTGYFLSKDLALTGTVEHAAGSMVFLVEKPGGPAVECYMEAPVKVHPGQVVTIRGDCLQGDRGLTLSNAVLTRP